MSLYKASVTYSEESINALLKRNLVFSSVKPR